jgi:hypothetical protein
MAISAELMEQIDAVLAQASADGPTLARLRGLVAGLTATRCDASDLADSEPFRSYEHCALYLLDGRDHCMMITDDPTTATGVVVVAKK